MQTASSPNASARATTSESSSSLLSETGQIIQASLARYSITLRCYPGHATNPIEALNRVHQCRRTCSLLSSLDHLATSTSRQSTRPLVQSPQEHTNRSSAETPAIHTSKLTSNHCNHPRTTSRLLRPITNPSAIHRQPRTFRSLQPYTRALRHSLAKAAATKRPFSIRRARHTLQSLFPTVARLI